MSKSAKLFIKIFVSVTVAGVIIALGVLAGALMGFIDTTSDLNIEDLNLHFTSFVYYKDPKTGEDVEFERLYGEQNRVWVDFAYIPDHLQKAAIAIEDERFYLHSGFDIKSTTKATFTYLLNHNSARGASTITQQLIKNITGDKDRSPLRKIQEIVRAVNLEQKFSKDQILELYLNTIYLSQGCNGVGSAANFYFDKEVKDLTIAESAALIGITQFPTKYDPIVNPQNNKEKQELILKKMLELSYISNEQYDSAVAEKLKFTSNSKTVSASRQSYFVDEIIREVLNDLEQKKGLTEPLATKMLYSGGLKIYSTIDPQIQEIMNSVYINDANFAKAPTKIQPESSMSIIDPYTGYIKGVVGGRGEKNASRTLNRATQTYRQPGSTIKPIAVYAPAIEHNIITPYSVYEDKKVQYGNWSPKNYYSGFKGFMTVKQAVDISVNTIPVQILEKMGVSTSYNFLKDKLGITTLSEQDKNLGSLALGGLTNGVSNIELAAAYSAFINKGIYNKPTTYTKVVDSSGKTVLENKQVGKVAFTEETAAIMTGLLKSVVDNGTGAAAKFSGEYSIGGKTGTTDNDVDRWFVGFTPYYVGVVWFGFDTPQTMSFYSANPTIPVWKRIMSEIHSKKKLSAKVFEKSPNVSYVNVCIDSGKLATEACGDRVRTDYFKKGTAPTQYCDVHKKVKICSLSNMVATESCPPELLISPQTDSDIKNKCNIHGAVHTSPQPSVAPDNTP